MTYNAKLRGNCGREEFGGAHSAAAEWGSTECDSDCDPKREEEGQSGQKGYQDDHGERRRDIGRKWRAGACAGGAAAVSGVWLHEKT